MSVVSLDEPVERSSGPEDWRDEIIYFIMTDRFKDGDPANNVHPDGDSSQYNPSNINAWHGGDFKGILSEIDYLRRMGMTSVWITPIVEPVRWDYNTAGYHGYWAHDFSNVSYYLTSAGDLGAGKSQDNTNDRKEYFENFVQTMHENGLLVIQDIVTNHIGSHALYKTGPGESDWSWTPTYNDSGYDKDTEYFFLDETPCGAHQEMHLDQTGLPGQYLKTCQA
jgi:glycosidase